MRRFPWELGAIAGPMLMTAAWILLGVLSPGYTAWGVHVAPYSPISQPISGLGLGPTGPYMNATFIVTGVLMAAGAIAALERIPGLRFRHLCAALLGLPGLGSVIDGVFTFQSFFMHFAGFALVLTTAVTFPVVGSLLRKTPAWRTFGTALIAGGPLTVVLTVIYFATFTPSIQGIQTGVAGLTERVLVVEIQAWYVAFGWLAYRRSHPSAELALTSLHAREVSTP